MPPSGPARGLWIEMLSILAVSICSVSGPARGLWIEISCFTMQAPALPVGPREGPVD